MKYLVRQGVPNHLRSEIWHVLIQKQVNDIRKEKGSAYYQHLCHLLPNSDVNITKKHSFSSLNTLRLFQLNNKFEKQIALDLHRTMPTNIRFSSKDSDGVSEYLSVISLFVLEYATDTPAASSFASILFT